MNVLPNPIPERIALICQGHEISFANLDHDVDAMAKKFKKLPQGIIALTAENKSTFVIQLLAAFLNNQPVAVFANHWSQKEINDKFDLLGHALRVDEQGNIISMNRHSIPRCHEKTALILFTSGSTGQSKAVQLSQENIKTNCRAVIDSLNFSATDNQWLFLPLSYSFGLLGQLLPGLMAGITTHLTEGFAEINAMFVSKLIPRMWSGVPSHWSVIMKMAEHFPSVACQLTHVISAGAKLSRDLRVRLIEMFPNAVIYNNYGLTEASPRVLTLSSQDPLFLSEYVGYPVGDWRLKLSKEQELFIYGKQVMLGYLGERNSAKIQDGWLATGDLAEITPIGLVSIKGRCDYLVNIGGEKISLDEIERIINQCSLFAEVVVIPVEDVLYGTRLMVFLEKSGGEASCSKEQLLQTIQQRFGRYVPLQLHVMASLPRNKNGKLDRAALTVIAQNYLKDKKDA
ncbi:class I adenylate-forming enzyme family protein [Legionella nagasakiensis]|uniref:class I adenylate-forming enzyme family protein n=1 Tax=Legionella nagasakiensis TaxID=535290 RepID=UPI001055797B|nr:class I adenylate-forming enzyme family protein [Legionella nagasakiensis]